MDAVRGAQRADDALDWPPHADALGWRAGAGAAAAELRARLPYSLRLQAAAGAVALGAAYLLALRRLLPPGGRRLAAALPLLALHAAVPLLFDSAEELLSRAVAAACVAWLSSCKARRVGAGASVAAARTAAPRHLHCARSSPRRPPPPLPHPGPRRPSRSA
jgi:hypothetical protein